jgi:hypothetical protein
VFFIRQLRFLHIFILSVRSIINILQSNHCPPSFWSGKFCSSETLMGCSNPAPWSDWLFHWDLVVSSWWCLDNWEMIKTRNHPHSHLPDTLDCSHSDSLFTHTPLICSHSEKRDRSGWCCAFTALFISWQIEACLYLHSPYHTVASAHRDAPSNWELSAS